jgi:short-subunit dehydrogenase
MSNAYPQAVELRGATCLVTGASSGIGRATALRLSREGARVVALGRDRAALEGLGAWRLVVADLAQPGAARRAAQETGEVDVVVNNAGIGWAGPFMDMPADEIERLVAVNLLAPVALTRALVPAMVARGDGHVVNVCSIVAHTGGRGEAVYAATKGALAAFTESLRLELAGSGVGVSLVTPGVIDTPFFERRGAAYARRWPRPVPAERVAGAVVAAIERGRAEVFVPGWLAGPARLRGAAPGLFRRLAGRFG